MSYIHFKTAFNVNYDKVTFDGTSISLTQLKKLIAEKLRFSKLVDYDLEITNAETNQGRSRATLFTFSLSLIF
jgi:hypothetical protein